MPWYLYFANDYVEGFSCKFYNQEERIVKFQVAIRPLLVLATTDVTVLLGIARFVIVAGLTYCIQLNAQTFIVLIIMS